MIIDCISDLHGHYPKLEGGDLLIVAGDLTRNGDSENEFALFDYWINEQKYKKKIVIAGNHDNVLGEDRLKFQFCEYLCDSGTEFEGLKIWGSPWTKTFTGMNPKCKAFTVDTEEELAEKWALIPEDTDILITHSPPYGILDQLSDEKHVGSLVLRDIISKLLKLKCHVFGHIHEGYGQTNIAYIADFLWDYRPRPIGHKAINASHVNEYYEPFNKSVRIMLP